MNRKTRQTLFVYTMIGLIAVVFATTALAQPTEPGPNFSQWFEAAVVGPPVSLDTEWEGCPFISKNGLELFFRIWSPGTAWDIYVSHRDSTKDPWGEPVNLGPNINTGAAELCSFVTIDGHWLYFVSNRRDLESCGSFDLYVSHRKNKRDPTGWDVPTNLGCHVNSPFNDNGPSIFEDDATGEAIMYFSSNRPEGQGRMDIWASEMVDKETFGEAYPVEELNTPDADLHSFLRRKDGLELIFGSDHPYPGAIGDMDLYVVTRPTTSDPWSEPVNLGPNVNSEGRELRPSISWDGTELYFWTERPPWPSTMDVYQATRTKLTGKDK